MDSMEIINIDDLSLMGFSRSKNRYAANDVPPLPFSFNVVMEGQTPTSSAFFFRLPDEILAMILVYVDDTSLEPMALVDRSFNQLARSRQFCSILFDFSPAKLELLAHLAEAGDCRSTSTVSSRIGIGICVRRFTVATESNNFLSACWQERERRERRTGYVVRSDSNSLSNDIFAKELYRGAFSKLDFILTRPHALPNLSLLDWEDCVLLPGKFYQRLLTSHFRHLNLSHALVRDDFPMELINEYKFPGITSLHLQIDKFFETGMSKSRLRTFCSRFLRQCAPTLERLTWIASIMGDKDQSILMGIPEPPQFSKLTVLDIRAASRLESESLEVFLQAPLTTLAMSGMARESTEDALSRRGCIPTLKVLVWDGRWELPPSEKAFDFLRNNPQLERLSIPSSDPDVLDEYLLPVLTSHLLRLTSLEMHWDAIPDLADYALEQICQLRSLEQLSLILDHDFLRTNWEINHERIASFLQHLPKLRRLAFAGDTYLGKRSADLPIIDYYGAKDLTIESQFEMASPEFYEKEHFEARDILWERQHEKRMLQEAVKYATLMPSLEWLNFGQLHMVVFDTQGGRDIRVVGKRNSSQRLLRTTFEWDGVGQDGPPY